MIILYIILGLIGGFAVGATLVLLITGLKANKRKKTFSYNEHYSKKDVKKMAATNNLLRNEKTTVDGTNPTDQYVTEDEQYVKEDEEKEE